MSNKPHWSRELASGTRFWKVKALKRPNHSIEQAVIWSSSIKKSKRSGSYQLKLKVLLEHLHLTQLSEWVQHHLKLAQVRELQDLVKVDQVMLMVDQVNPINIPEMHTLPPLFQRPSPNNSKLPLPKWKSSLESSVRKLTAIKGPSLQSILMSASRMATEQVSSREPSRFHSRNYKRV